MKKARGAIGFFLTTSTDSLLQERMIVACQRMLHYFPWLKYKQWRYGQIMLGLLSHHLPEDSIYLDPDGNLFLLIGSPANALLWPPAIESLNQKKGRFELPWEGRCLLVKISSDHQECTIWNDWTGSIPVFHVESQNSFTASSLEPVVVAAAKFTCENFSHRGLVEILIHGHFLGTDTLFEGMQTLPADSRSSWKNNKFEGSKVLYSVAPNEDHWNKSPDQLIALMYEQTLKAVKDSMEGSSEWILPLSGGMDSKLLACVGRDLGASIKAFTYGPENWNEVRYASRVAEILDIPWQRIDLGAHYLADYAPMWLDWFGTCLNAHGLYQISFLRQIEKYQGIIPHGWYGNNCAGGNNPSKRFLETKGSAWEGFYKGYGIMWAMDELQELVSFDVLPVIEEIKTVIENQLALVQNWPYYHQKNAVDMWNRQQRFVFYQSVMYDFWKGSLTPFMDRTYAQFFFSLPIWALDIRYLQRLMLKKYWPALAEIGGTYQELYSSNARYFSLKKFSSRWIPWPILINLSKKLGKVPNTMELDCVQADGVKALFPLTEDVNGEGILNEKIISQTINRCLKYDQRAYNKLSVLQPIIYRMLGK